MIDQGSRPPLEEDADRIEAVSLALRIYGDEPPASQLPATISAEDVTAGIALAEDWNADKLPGLERESEWAILARYAMGLRAEQWTPARARSYVTHTSVVTTVAGKAA